MTPHPGQRLTALQADEVYRGTYGGSHVNVYDAHRRDEKRRLVALAIDQAMASQWLQAIDTNLHLITIAGHDVETHNRLGTAYTHLGRTAEAQAAYATTLQLDPTNVIAQRNMTRLAALMAATVSSPDS